jgi:hypothetical protein
MRPALASHQRDFPFVRTMWQPEDPADGILHGAFATPRGDRLG